MINGQVTPSLLNGIYLDSIVKLAEENIGAADCLQKCVNELGMAECIFPFLCRVFTRDLRGSNLYLVWNDTYKRNVHQFIEYILGRL